MANTNYTTSGTIGSKLDSTRSITEGANRGLGETAMTNNGGMAMYVKCSTTAITQYDCVHINDTFRAQPITSALALTGGKAGFAQVAFATSDFGWVLLTGKPRVRVAASTLPNVPLYTSDTAGVLDDATASLSQCTLLGLLAVASASTGVNPVTCNASWVIIRRANV